MLVAPVTGEAGRIIQEWRRKFDPVQALRLPPHLTLCYQVPPLPLDMLERQVRHAFDTSVIVRLGGVRQMANRDRTFYVEVLDTAALDRARGRLYDGRFCTLGRLRAWRWHITCLRYAAHRPDLKRLQDAARAFQAPSTWRIDAVACLELRDDRYVTLAAWRV